MAVPPSFSRASATPVAVWASIGPTGRPTSSVNWSSAGLPPESTSAATAGRFPLNIAARRTSGVRTSAAFATASAIRPMSAPWRSSPPSSRRRNVCSASVAALKTALISSDLRAWEPLPATAPISVNAASTPRTVSDGSAAGAGSDLSAAQPTPI